MTFVAIDFEASCLPRDGRSFPIEVAISGIEGTRSWLIRPAPQWHDWCWTEDAGRLHGIPRPIIEHEGRAPATVLTELGAAIAGRRVFADSSLDADWLATLAAAAGRAASFRIEHASLFVDPLRANAGEVAKARAFADIHSTGRHRAGPDAYWLWCLLDRLDSAVATRTPHRIAA